MINVYFCNHHILCYVSIAVSAAGIQMALSNPS